MTPALGDTRGPSDATALLSSGKDRFDVGRRALSRLQARLATQRADARREHYRAARVLAITLWVAGVLVVIGMLAAAVVLRRVVPVPLARLGRQARRAADGDFDTPLTASGGAREIGEVRSDVDGMRARIVRELAAAQAARARLQEQAAELERANTELQRSNTELEQFAYVASHDLQEPLRKVTSFCQALERRYHGQLDERADQYIDFAVDGAKRMQVLINDLLAFSRVGRSGRAHELLAASDLVADARSSLSAMLEDAGATVLTGDLPVVRGDRALLASVFQNLIANAVKFRGVDAPRVRIRARREDGEWQFSCCDNGIGIDPQYAERIFVIFQRLHPKDAYPGTGIGLAMCRKIVEHHGGRIWLDTDHSEGACLRFTLPTPEEPQQ